MINTKHTPGMWREFNGYTETTFTSVGSSNSICYVPHDGDFVERNGERPSYRTMTEQNKANARLIAAAPDLLAALVELSSRYQCKEATCSSDPGMASAQDKALAAISKATRK